MEKDKLNDMYKKDAKIEFVEKKSYRKPIISITSTIDVANRIDLYDHEANAMGCKIFNYDYYDRQRKITMMLMIGVLGLYFLVGLMVGYAIALT